jgi:RNA recognition motif-containing protein
MASEEEAKKAVEMLNGKELDGRTLIVDEARPMKKSF